MWIYWKQNIICDDKWMYSKCSARALHQSIFFYGHSLDENICNFFLLIYTFRSCNGHRSVGFLLESTTKFGEKKIWNKCAHQITWEIFMLYLRFFHGNVSDSCDRREVDGTTNDYNRKWVIKSSFYGFNSLHRRLSSEWD